ncbi:hypothetical protein ZOSMA_298G00020 [Zostera marina]|uniref:Uncharacterized protein n=1 Tax=Zostera marina TaxID=29655 RepID=A0A0K9PC18_ZOSMR|nr:hypothetical protein ZOSMA_298G00020 [Zostera marina]
MVKLKKDEIKVHNLMVLKRIDRFIEDIFIVASHVVLYELMIDVNQYIRKDVEGSLFVVKRTCQPVFRIIVLNYQNKITTSILNFIEDINGDLTCEVKSPYFIYENAKGKVNVVWFHNPVECESATNRSNNSCNTTRTRLTRLIFLLTRT